LTGAVVALVASLALRSPLRMDVIRDRNTLARLTTDGAIENTYRLQLMNAGETPLKVRVSVTGIDGLATSGLTEFTVPAAANRMVPFGLTLDRDTNPLAAGAHPIRLRVEAFPEDPAHPRAASPVARLEERAVFTM